MANVARRTHLLHSRVLPISIAKPTGCRNGSSRRRERCCPWSGPGKK